MSRSTRLRKTRLLVNSPQTVVYDALLWLYVKLLSLLHVVFLVFLGSLAAARVSSPCAEFFLIARNIFIFFLVLFRVMRKQTTIKKRVGFGCTRKKGAMSEIDDFLARRLRANKFAMGTTFLCEILIFQAEHRWTVFQSRPRMLATSWYQDRNFHRQTFPFYAYNAYVTELLDDTKGQNMRE